MSLLPKNIDLNEQEQDRLEDLLVAEATQGLGPTEHQELLLLLERGLGEEGAEVLLESMHLTVTVAELGLLQEALERQESSAANEMPVSVEAELRKLAAQEAKRTQGGEVVSFEDARVKKMGLSPAWWLAAAALFLALLGWWPRLPFDARDGAEADTPSPGDLVQTEGLLEESASTLVLAFQATDDSTAAVASGSLLWNKDLQQGEMRISDLEINDPNVFQYQLWIFDAERDERHPVDGGVFDISADGLARIPIRARVPVSEATLFAITIEPPGGVVVSKRERIVLIAQPS